MRLTRLAGLALALILLLTGCSPMVEEENSESLSVYATFYPIYALAEMVIGGVPDVELHCLVQPQDGCLRSYSMSDWDLSLLAASADVVIAGGRGLESFEGTLEALSDQASILLIEALSGLTLFQEDEETDEESTHFDGANPHLYMSVDGAMSIVENIETAMVLLDADHAEDYRSNAAAALSELEALKAEIQQETADCAGQSAAVLNEALVYAAQDYGLEIATTVVRESGERLYDSQLEQCVEMLEQSGAKVVLIERQAPKPFVDELEAAGFAVAQLDVLSTLGETDGAQGYFDALRENARAVAEAFSRAEGEEVEG